MICGERAQRSFAPFTKRLEYICPFFNSLVISSPAMYFNSSGPLPKSVALVPFNRICPRRKLPFNPLTTLRLNGCDYDSDSMLVTDDKLLVETAEKYKEYFKVPVCDIPSMSKSGQTLADLDHDTSENKIGEIVNLSQKLNSIIWNEIHHGAPKEKILDIYNDVCKLAVLSGLEIDKAKRSYDNVNVGKELSALRKKYNRPAPMFFKEIDERDKENEYEFYDTAMDYIYQAVKNLTFKKVKRKG